MNWNAVIEHFREESRRKSLSSMAAGREGLVEAAGRDLLEASIYITLAEALYKGIKKADTPE